MIEFKTFDDLLKYFNHQNIKYEHYLKSLTREELNYLINKPNFWKDIIQKVRMLTVFKNNLEIQKLIVDNIIKNDFYIMVNDNNILNIIVGYIKPNKELFEYFLSSLNTEQLKTVLDIIFENGLDLNLLPTTNEVLNKIEQYIDNLTEKDNKSIINLYKSLYATKNVSTNTIGKTILKRLIKNKFHLSFYKFYGELIYPEIKDDETSEIVICEPTLKEQEKIIELFFLLLTSVSEYFHFADEETAIHTVRQLSNFGEKRSEKLLGYMINLVKNGSYLLEIILANKTLIQYIDPSIIIKGLTTNIDYSNKDEVIKLLSNDNINPNLISLFDTQRLLIIFPLATLNYDIYMKALKSFLKKYFTYERAIFFISSSYIPEKEKIKIIKELYQKDISNVLEEKTNLIKRAIDDILSQKEPVPEYIKDILPELIALPYNEMLLKKLKEICLTINQEEYLKVFLSQLFKEKNLKNQARIDGKSLYFNPKLCETLGQASTQELEVRIEEYDIDKLEEQNREYIETLYHENTHLYQFNIMPSKISIDSLLVAFDWILYFNGKYSDNNYWELYFEIHARTHGHYDTWKLIRDITPTINDNNPKEYFVEDRRIFRSNSFKAGDNNPQVKNHSTTFFANLINTFFSKISSEDIMRYRKKYKTLELITNEQGIPYTPEEIEGFINNFKASDLKYDATNKAIYTFYIRYLHLLTDGLNLSDGRINIYDETTLRRRVS